jgi:hypothetical protein
MRTSRIFFDKTRLELNAVIFEQIKKPLFPGAFSLNSNPGNQATLRINLSRNSSGIRSCNTRAWAIATSAI